MQFPAHDFGLDHFASRPFILFLPNSMAYQIYDWVVGLEVPQIKGLTGGNEEEEGGVEWWEEGVKNWGGVTVSAL